MLQSYGISKNQPLQTCRIAQGFQWVSFLAWASTPAARWPCWQWHLGAKRYEAVKAWKMAIDI